MLKIIKIELKKIIKTIIINIKILLINTPK